MAGFGSKMKDGVRLWRGNTTCQEAHEYLAEQLRAMATPLSSSTRSLSVRIQGNLGEFMALCIRRDFGFPDAFKPFASNAYAPLVDISRADVDILWLRLGKKTDKDLLVVHEVKTTTDPGLGLARGLIGDHEKLFGNDTQLTLHSRLMWLANKIEFEWKRPHLCDRIHKLAGDTPQTSTRIHLRPTLVHERFKGKPRSKLLAVRDSIVVLGWDISQIQPWSIALDDFESRLLRIAKGQG